MRRAFFSLGTNLGDRREHLANAVATLREHDACRLSSVYESAPLGGVAQDDFWNMVMELRTDATPRELLERARRAETRAGRIRDVRWGPRTLDVDVILIEGETSEDPEVLVPHPMLYQRNFVLVPLHELAPDLLSDRDVAGGEGVLRELGTLESLR